MDLRVTLIRPDETDVPLVLEGIEHIQGEIGQAVGEDGQYSWTRLWFEEKRWPICTLALSPFNQGRIEIEAAVSKAMPTPGPWIKFQLSPDSDKRQRWIVTTADGEREICGIIGNEADADILAASWDLLAGLKGVMGLIESGQLRRNTSDDASPDFAIRQLPFTMALAAAFKAIEDAEGRSA